MTDNTDHEVEDLAADEHEAEVTFTEGGLNPKVAAGGTAGAATILLVWLLAQAGVDLPPEVASAVTTLIGFAAGWLKSA